MKLSEKIGYGFGDMSSSMFWKLFSYFLPFFYSNVFGLSLADAGVLMLVTRIWDAVSDPMMGIIADRTKTRWGKYRPYLLFFAIPFAVCGILLFTTPENGKVVWAYVTYLMMMTVYTGINVPYGSLLNVMTADSDEKSVLSSYRMFFAYGGSFIALFAWEPLCNMFDKTRVAVEGASGLAAISTSPDAWQKAMIVIATCCFVLFILSFLLTKEHVRSESTVSVGKDLGLLVRNKPWWLLIGAALASNLFNTVRGTTTAYFFADYIQQLVSLDGRWAFLVSAGIFLSIGEIANMVGVVLAVPMSKHLGKKSTYIISMAALVGLSIAFFFLPATAGGYWAMLAFQIIISIFTGVISPLVWSMYADVADYSELKDGTASTGLIFSSASMAQKFGGAFGGAAVMWMLAAFGYDTTAGVVQTETAITGLRILMSWVPAAVATLAILVTWFYPLTKKKMEGVQVELAARRGTKASE
ncbi:MAG: MFS transporter [Bacteroidales bacterium]|nr:MFS transporter [Bacteroidales bacterium]